MAKYEKLLKNLGLKLGEFKTKALQFKSTLKPKMPAGYKMKALPSRPTYRANGPSGSTGSSGQHNNVGIAPASAKNPKNVAQQIKNPEVKQDAMKQAKSLVKYLPNGQWVLQKKDDLDNQHHPRYKPWRVKYIQHSSDGEPDYIRVDPKNPHHVTLWNHLMRQNRHKIDSPNWNKEERKVAQLAWNAGIDYDKSSSEESGPTGDPMGNKSALHIQYSVEHPRFIEQHNQTRKQLIARNAHKHPQYPVGLGKDKYHGKPSGRDIAIMKDNGDYLTPQYDGKKNI